MFLNKFGTIGAGNMGMAIVGGLSKSDVFAHGQIGIYDTNHAHCMSLASLGYNIMPDEVTLFGSAPKILLAVKPQGAPDVLQKLAAAPYQGQVLVSICAGISISYIQSVFPHEIKVIRVMPNTPLLIRQGTSAFSKSDNVSEEEFNEVIGYFAQMGSTVVIQESQMNEIIPVHGSSPAFVYYIINCMVESAKKQGIDPAIALPMICQTFIGSANMVLDKMVLERGEILQQLIKNVCSPGGTTLEAIRVFDEQNLGGIFDEAFEKCIKRAYELGK